MTMSSQTQIETPRPPEGRPPPLHTPRRGWGRAASVIVLVVSLLALGLSGAALSLALKLQWEAGAPNFASQARAYIEGHPEVIIDSLNRAEARRKDALVNAASEQLSARRAEIFNDPASPVGGNAAGDATLVEFFDYNCPYCRKAAPLLGQPISDDPKVKVIYKEFPILGPGSLFAARAALAAQKQGKYLAFHDALYAAHGPITEAATIEVARSVGLDVDRLKTDMADPEIDAAIKSNLALAEALQISGTPTWVTPNRVTPGLVGLDALKAMIKDERKG